MSRRSKQDASLSNAPTAIDDELLKQWPLPDPHQASDKDERGRVLLVGGSAQMPGAITLAALGAMRAGAGKLCIATGASVAQLVAQSMPEARVIGLDESDSGGLHATSVDRIDFAADCILIGPGMQDEDMSVALCGAILTKFPTASVVLDAIAMSIVLSDQWNEMRTGNNISETSSTAQRSTRRATVITPHAGEMAHLMKVEKEVIEHDRRDAAASCAKRWTTTIALKGAETFVANPSGAQWLHRGGNVGLATSGSGDVLAGIITGLCARGASTEQAVAWGVRVHACAGDALEERYGPVGFLARELPGEIPRILRRLG